MIPPKVEVKKILYATDLSENARFAFAYAVSLADLYNAAITIIHVLPEVSDLLDKNVIGYISAERWEEIKAQHFKEAKEALIGKRREHQAVQEALHHFSEKVKEGQEGEGFITDDIIVERGNPVEQIIKRHPWAGNTGRCHAGKHRTAGDPKIQNAGASRPAPRRIKPAFRASSLARWLRCEPFQNAHVLRVRSAFETAHALPSNKS
jgi:nucleotide-binding universal stress UspA family protein